jgi:glycosyltransferase involved in cell wall biosynthesis
MRICLITPGQPSNNPRFVKEADALVEAGHTVHAVCSDCGLWPSRMDGSLMAAKRWTLEYAGGAAAGRPLRYKATRLRHSLGRRMLRWNPESSVFRRWAIVRAAPELASAALRRPADLYIAHHPSVLPIAIQAARLHGGRVGYDVEDFYSGMYPIGSEPSRIDRLVEQIETEHLPYCSYVTAASPAYADAYVAKYGIQRPVPVLNVFPLSDRPDEFPPTPPLGQPVRLYWFSQVLGSGRGLEDVIRALGIIKDCSSELHLRGNWLTGYREKLFATAKEAGVKESAIFVYPPAPPSEMVRLAAKFDVGLCVEQPVDHSRPLGVTNKTFVSLLAGNAIVSTNMTGQKPVLDLIGPAAFRYEPGDFQALAAGLKQWHDDRNALDFARRESWDWGARRYNWEFEKHIFLDTIEAVFSDDRAGVRHRSRQGYA